MSMEVTDFMFGDWVMSCRHDHPLKVTGIQSFGRYFYIETDAFFGTLTSEEIKPIPLTEEILLANGFEISNEQTFYKEFRICLNKGSKNERWIYIEYHHKSDYIKLMCQPCTGHDDGISGIVLNHCNVHQLQHILRICCFNDVADSFKIKQ